MKNIKLNLQIYNTHCHTIPNKKKIKKWIYSVVKKKCEITIRIVDTIEMRNMNFKYRNNNKITNILSFPFQGPKFIQSLLIGDLIICEKKIIQEACMQNKKLDMHWAHIIIHGILHLLGYNHENKKTNNIMKSIERKTMKKIGYKNFLLL